jgi:hypothetical protein
VVSGTVRYQESARHVTGMPNYSLQLNCHNEDAKTCSSLISLWPAIDSILNSRVKFTIGLSLDLGYAFIMLWSLRIDYTDARGPEI